MRPRRPAETFAAAALAAALVALGAFGAPAAAEDSPDEIREKIEEQRDIIRRLDAEIEEQRKKLLRATQETQTLDGAVRNLDASARAIDTSIRKTQAAIREAELEIERLSGSIQTNAARAESHRAAVGRLLGSLDAEQEQAGIEIVLGAASTDEVWGAVDAIGSVRDDLLRAAQALAEANERLTADQLASEVEKKRLDQKTAELAGERESVASAREQKAELLAAAKGTEAEYQRLLAEKVAQKTAFESALREFENELDIAINKDSYAAADHAAFSWPLGGGITLTQLFGGTEFAKQHAHAYGRPFHPGLDFGAPVGTPILAIGDGEVVATGNTDAVRGCYSWGKWVLVEHGNGITSLYAHMSGIATSEGAEVERGQTIGYVGQTGYATGPHLHLTLYASEGVQVRRFEEFKTQTGCAGATTPVAPHEAYLDPQDYLPESGFRLAL
jgi:murein DD-endopeptidase MepM/ murein hydrolase activator NlpD